MPVIVTVNGVPLKQFVEAAVNDEIQKHRKYEVGTIAKAASTKVVTSSIRNHSGSRSGRGRIIMQGGVLCR